MQKNYLMKFNTIHEKEALRKLEIEGNILNLIKIYLLKFNGKHQT